jgi:RNA polymerase sigma factor (sigma-70 family)
MQALALKNLLNNDIAELSEKEERVIKLRFGFDGNEPMKLRQIATILEMSPEGIRRIETKALKKLKQNLMKKGIYGVLN